MSDDRKRQDVVADRRVRPAGKGPRERRVEPPALITPDRRQKQDPWDDGRRDAR